MQVEFVEGLDVIVLRGSERDVQRVMEIIKQIEELSAVTVPEIEIYELKYVDSVQMGALLQRLVRASARPAHRHGEHHAARQAERAAAHWPAGKREDGDRADPAARSAGGADVAIRSVSAAARLGGRSQNADRRLPGPGPARRRPADNDARRPAAVPAAARPAPSNIPTLAPRALVVADPRTNSLIVSAGPRDMAEIAALVARIDTPGAAAELKVFTIVNGDADGAARHAALAVLGAGRSGGGGGDGAAAPAAALGQGGPVRMQFSVDHADQQHHRGR